MKIGDRCVIEIGDARDVLARLRPDSIDALVCDPPAGISFMGKVWDHDHGHRDEWIKAFASIFALALRAMKPGAHGLVWALPRTSHWTATALEDAGFEVRDVIMHLFGTGFPKSLDVSKAVDSFLTTGQSEAKQMYDGSRRERRVDENGRRYALPGAQTDLARSFGTEDLTRAEAEAWRGYGTALKPAAEHWILVRKPLVGTVAANVLAHGTGGLNIGACRIAVATDDSIHAKNPHTEGGFGHAGATVYGASNGAPTYDPSAGRWPANVTLDEEAAALLDEQSGPMKDGVAVEPDGKKMNRAIYGETNTLGRRVGFGGGGGASRFFYVAKPGRKERDLGCEDLPARSGGEATDREDGTDGLKSPRAGAGRTGGAKNHHPTVKSVALMRYLVRLVTPPGGIVLDPFLGSGSTGIAALAEGFTFVGVEREAEYVEIARRRIAASIGVEIEPAAATPAEEFSPW